MSAIRIPGRKLRDVVAEQRATIASQERELGRLREAADEHARSSGMASLEREHAEQCQENARLRALLGDAQAAAEVSAVGDRKLSGVADWFDALGALLRGDARKARARGDITIYKRIGAESMRATQAADTIRAIGDEVKLDEIRATDAAVRAMMDEATP